MGKTTKTVESVENDKPNFFKSPAHLLLLLAVLVVLVVVGVYIKQNNQKVTAPTTTVTSVSEPTMSLTSSNNKPAPSSDVTVTVLEDSTDKAVNAVQATIDYPADKLEFVSFDNTDSAFEIQPQATNKEGQIMIAKGHNGNLTGRQTVTKINFKVKPVVGTAALKFDQGTYLVATSDSKDILKQTSGLDLSIGAKE